MREEGLLRIECSSSKEHIFDKCQPDKAKLDEGHQPFGDSEEQLV